MTLTDDTPGLAVDAEPLFTIVDAIERLSGAQTVEDVAAVVLAAARSISGADGVAVVLRDGDQCFYLDEDAISPLWKGRRFPLTSCVSGWAMLNRRTAIIPDIYADDRVPVDAYRPTFVKSLVMTPVRPHDPIAAIGAYWAEERSWTRDELVKLEAVARATATALENARLYASLNDALRRRDEMIRELDHRVKNTLATVQAIAFQTQRSAASPRAFVDSMNGRLQALARAHELLTRQAWTGADLEQVILEAMKPFVDPGAGRVSLAGPAIRLAPEASMAAQLIFFELADNAAKFGALSNGAGRVDVAWSASAADGFVLDWTEAGGPPIVQEPERGFGSRLVERGLAGDLAGKATLAFDPQGLRFHMCAPLDVRISLA